MSHAQRRDRCADFRSAYHAQCQATASIRAASEDHRVDRNRNPDLTPSGCDASPNSLNIPSNFGLDGGEIAECVLLDSVQSQANRMELALLDARFDQEVLLKKFTVTSLEAPHRAADAIFRDSTYSGTMFRKSGIGRV